MFPVCAASTGFDGSPPGFFASKVTVLCVAPESEQLPDQVPVDLPDIQIHDPVYPCIPEEDNMDVSTEVSDTHVPCSLPHQVSSAFHG